MGTVPGRHGYPPLCECHGKSEALIFVLDCSSPIFIAGNFLGIFVPISLGGRREERGGRVRKGGGRVREGGG